MNFSIYTEQINLFKITKVLQKQEKKIEKIIHKLNCFQI